MLAERLAEARRQTDSLFDILKPEALYERPVAERHRIIFYVGHLEAFDWNLLGDRPVHAEFDKLFAFGIDPLGEGLPTDQPKDWPGIEEIILAAGRPPKNEIIPARRAAPARHGSIHQSGTRRGNRNTRTPFACLADMDQPPPRRKKSVLPARAN